MVRAGLRLLEEHERHVKALQALEVEEAPGAPEPLDIGAFKAERRAERAR